MTLHTNLKQKKATKAPIIVVTVLLVISIITNIYFLYERKKRDYIIISPETLRTAVESRVLLFRSNSCNRG